jgi:hypothetical protein
MQRCQLSTVSVALAAMALGLGCARSTNDVQILPVSTSRPVSLSDQYIDAQGNTVTAEQYRQVKSFSFGKEVEVPHHRSRLTTLDLSGDLEQVIRETGADALTNTRIEALDYDTGSHGSKFVWKGAGWTFAGGGATLLLVGGAAESSGLATFGITMIGAGVVSYVIGATHKKPTRWRFQVRGDAVEHSH